MLSRRQVSMAFSTVKGLREQILRVVRDFESRHGELELDVQVRIRQGASS